MPKIHNCLSEVPGRAVVSNCGTPTENSQDATMLTAGDVDLYPSNRHGAGLEALRKAIDDRVNKKDFYWWPEVAGSVLKTHYSEFNEKFKKHIFGTAVGT